MHDGDHLLKAWDNRDWPKIGGIVGTNVAFVCFLFGCFMLLQLLGIYALDAVDALPCLCL